MTSKTQSLVSEDVLAEAIICCDSWEPEARLIGNVRAIDLGDLLRELRGRRREFGIAESAARGLGLQLPQFEAAMHRLADETKADPELTRLGLPRSWNRACEYALKVEPNGLDETAREAGQRYMDVRNAYIAGAEGDDEFRQKPIVLRGAVKTEPEPR